MKRIVNPLILCFFLFSAKLYAQDSIAPHTIKISAFVDVYSVFNANQPKPSLVPGFLYNHTYTNQVALNLAYLKGEYQQKNARCNVSLMAGTYAEQNLAGEPPIFRYVYEANAGVRLSKKHNLWLDAGIFPSHIGFESAISKDCWTLTRSLCAENSPYYETGAKLTLSSKNEKWMFALLYLNGWQKIKRNPYSTNPNGGWQIQFKPNSKLLLNSSSYFGNEYADSVSRLRIFHNFYAVYQPYEKFGVTLGFDNGIEEKPKNVNASGYFSWYSPVVMLRYKVKPNFTCALRGEYYNDADAVVSSVPGKGVTGFSLNGDYAIHTNVVLRLEGKIYSHDKTIFPTRSSFSNNLFLLTMNLSAWF